MFNKIVLIAIVVGAFIFMSFLRDTQKKKKVVFFGDSITQAGVMPGGYISLMDTMLQKENITNYELVGAGIGGNKIYDLYLRMKEDVISKSPDVTVIYVGVNDVWHKSLFGTGTDYDKFERFYRATIKDLQAAGSKVMLVTPATIGEKKDYTNQQDGDLNKYSQLIRDIAKDLNLPICDLHKIFHDYEVEHNPENKDRGILTSDGVHFNADGNKLAAEEMWRVIKGMN